MRFMFDGMMPPWMMPFMQQEEQHQPPPDVMVPPRVRQAMEFIQMMTGKTMDRPAMTENQIQIVEGQELTDEEKNALATACNLVSRYFAGQLKPDAWESLRFDALKKKAEQGSTPGRIIGCVACNPMGPPNKGCVLCSGTGKILVQPVGQPPQPQGGGVMDIIMGMAGGRAPSDENDGDPPNPPMDGPEGFTGPEEEEPGK